MDRLRALWASGMGGGDIAALMGMTRNSIIGKAHRMGLPGRPSPIKRAADWVAPERKPPALAMSPCGRGASTIERTLPGAPAVVAAEPERTGWREPQGCQWHLGREGLRHMFCEAPIGPKGGAFCAQHHAICYRPVGEVNLHVA